MLTKILLISGAAILGVLSGLAASWGFKYTAEIWKGANPALAYWIAVSFFAIDIMIFIMSVGLLTAAGVDSALIQSIVWQVTSIGVLTLITPVARKDPVNIAIIILIAILLTILTIRIES